MPTFTAVIDTANPTISLTGVTLHGLNGASFGEPHNLAVLASFTMVAVPEPGTGKLIVLGLALFALSHHRVRPRRP